MYWSEAFRGSNLEWLTQYFDSSLFFYFLRITMDIDDHIISTIFEILLKIFIVSFKIEN
jgi:hypothetical protein